jgi:NAD(P)-dependent dehydrogenase (short-subunit alcohol dehydrogenase family)
MISLANKTILVTGASSGIGKVTAVELSKLGARIILTARNSEALNAVKNEMRGDHLVFRADLSDLSHITKLCKDIPAIDGWVHCAGKVVLSPAKFVKEEQLSDVFSINFFSAIHLGAGLLKENKLNGNSSIVFISSVSTLHSYFGGSLYISSKAALEGYAKTLALELAPKKIRVNTLQPGLVRTPIYEDTVKYAVSQEEMHKHEKRYPLGIGEPEDIANAVAFFLSDASKWITGSNLKMDGGLTMGV